MEQISFVALKCPNCGGRLEVTQQLTTFACGYCGAGVTVQRRGGTVSLSLEDAIARVQVGTDKTAAELALKRLALELEDARTECRAYESETNRGLQGYDLQSQAEKANIGAGCVLGGVAGIMSAVAGWNVLSWIGQTLSAKWLDDAAPVATLVIGTGCAVAVLLFVNGRGAAVRAHREAQRTAYWNSRYPGLQRIKSRVADIETRIAENRGIVDSRG